MPPSTTSLTARQCVELFHLTFLRGLVTGADRLHFAVKGGCNLRFFFGSLRYSEDMDVDVSVVAKGTLKNKVDRLLTSPVLTLPLQARGITLMDTSAPKQTETTQRWKLGLKVEGMSIPLRTKVEFSRRELALTGVATEAVQASVTRPLSITAPVAQHYSAATALQQKVAALAGRPQAQARDVFDLQLLRTKLDSVPRNADTASLVPKAIDNAMSLSFSEYQSQVVAYLAPEQADAYGAREVWDAMQLEVVELLEGIGA